MSTHRKAASAFLAAFGARIFSLRLVVGLTAAAVGIELLVPIPLFADGYRLLQVGGVLLIAAGLALRAWGAASAGDHTRTATIEAPQLATRGAFAYVRNPIYLGSIVLGIGMSCLIGDPLAFALTATTFAVLYFGIIPAEERFLRKEFGSGYEEYCRAVPRLVPRLSAWRMERGRTLIWAAAKGELLMLVLVVGIYGALWAEEYFDRLS